MSQADELLNSLANDGIALYTASPENEGHIVVDSNRFITVPEELKRIAVANDHNIETVTFDCPRYWDGHDMSTMKVYINYCSPDESLGCYLADNVSIDENDSNIMHFDWTITRNVASAKGEIAFLVCIKKTDDDGNEERHWNSELCKDMYISEGLECGEYLEKMYPDLYTQLLERIDDFEGSYPDQYPKVIEARDEAIKAKDEAIKIKDEINEASTEAKKIIDILEQAGISDGVVYTPNRFNHFYQEDPIDIFSSTGTGKNVVKYFNVSGEEIDKTYLIKSNIFDAECTIWQLSNFCRILYRVPLDYTLFKDIWIGAGQKMEVAKEAFCNFIIGKVHFNIAELNSLANVELSPNFRSAYNAGSVRASYDFIDFINDNDNFLGTVEVPANMRWKAPTYDNTLEIQLQNIGNFMYNPNYLYPNSENTDVNFPTHFTLDMTFPCKDIGGRVALEDLVKNYISISATEVSSSTNKLYSGGVE